MAFQPGQNPALNNFSNPMIGRTGMSQPRNAMYPNPSQNQQISNNEMDYKNFTLYVIPGDGPSQRATEIAAKYSDVQIKNIYQIPMNQRPPWLTGAPILLERQTNKAYPGSSAIRKLESLHQEDEVGIASYSQAGIGYAIESNMDTSHSSIVPILDDESRYGNGKLQEKDKEAYEKVREKSGVIPRQQQPAFPTS